MKVVAMPKTAPLLLVLGLLVGVTVSGQQNTQNPKPKSVKQGAQLPVQVMTDNPANVAGCVFVQVASDEGGQWVNSNCYELGAGRTAAAPVTIPYDAKIGKWKLTKVFFRVDGGGMPDKDLTPEGDLNFEVTAHDQVVLPAKAQIDLK